MRMSLMMTELMMIKMTLMMTLFLTPSCRASNTFSSALLPQDESEIYTSLSRKGHVQEDRWTLK